MNPYQPAQEIEPDRFERAWEEKLRRERIELLFWAGLVLFVVFFGTLFWPAGVLCVVVLGSRYYISLNDEHSQAGEITK